MLAFENRSTLKSIFQFGLDTYSPICHYSHVSQVIDTGQRGQRERPGFLKTENGGQGMPEADNLTERQQAGRPTDRGEHLAR